MHRERFPTKSPSAIVGRAWTAPYRGHSFIPTLEANGRKGSEAIAANRAGATGASI
jgi:hypothetical protein